MGLSHHSHLDWMAFEYLSRHHDRETQAQVMISALKKFTILLERVDDKSAVITSECKATIQRGTEAIARMIFQ